MTFGWILTYLKNESKVPLLLCLIGDRSVQQRVIAPLLQVVHRAAVVAIAAAATNAPLPLSHFFSSQASLPFSSPVSSVTAAPPLDAGLTVRGLRIAREPSSAPLVRRAARPRCSVLIRATSPRFSLLLTDWSTAATSRLTCHLRPPRRLRAAVRDVSPPLHRGSPLVS
ncbi:hypothetical protein Syun_000783 [Stephania yunnanensis]|uniref:Uncharacterized protein n=1 Tax=Stephania yunnanensis TaxID=152371 RepID=A0AAP0LCK5_9MAGN